MILFHIDADAFWVTLTQNEIQRFGIWWIGIRRNGTEPNWI